MKRLLLLSCILFVCKGIICAETIETSVPATVEPAPLTSNKTGYVLMIIPQYNFVDDEYSIPKVILSRAGWTVEVASQSTREVALGTDIMKVRPNLTVEQINADKYEALVMVGGYLSKKFYENPVLIEKVKEFNSKGKLIGAMDNMPYYLALWGLLRDVKVTVNPSMSKTLIKMGVNYIEKDIVIDKNIVSVNMAKYSDAFANEFLEALNNR
jgi:putative intracellular protease/amidase